MAGTAIIESKEIGTIIETGTATGIATETGISGTRPRISASRIEIGIEIETEATIGERANELAHWRSNENDPETAHSRLSENGPASAHWK